MALTIKTIEVGTCTYTTSLAYDYSSLQHLAADYGLYTWPSAPVLAQYVLSQKEWIVGKKILEVFIDLFSDLYM